MAISAVECSRKRNTGSSSAILRIAALAVLVSSIYPSWPQTTLQKPTPPRVAQARRFLDQRGWPTKRNTGPLSSQIEASFAPRNSTSAPSTSIWQPLGPNGVLTPNFGLVSGRVSAIAIDPADSTGNHVFIGTTGGGVWVSQNAATSGNVQFQPVTDTTAAFNNAQNTSISIGALTIQPGGTGIILAGTGDSNDALDSYYGAGILRSTDGGNTWTVISHTADQIYSFLGEGFAGFAWSTANPQLVVAAVSEAYEGTLVNAQLTNVSNAGLYYSTDAGATWSLATITDGAGLDVESPSDVFDTPHGNSVTAVVWNPVRQLFIAAVRFHGYYQSIDGITWTRMTSQPGTGFTQKSCPNNLQSIGSIACPIFRGALAVNPLTGDTFAWTVDFYNQDQGLWQDACAISNGTCSNQNISFSQRWSTAYLQSNTSLGPATIPNGDYNFALAAVPSGQDTFLLAGVNDLWKCSLAMGCIWRNTTNASTCMSAQVAPYQHALAWNTANPQEILVGNDSGLWRSMDAIAESGSVCVASDALHFQNLNSGIASLAEVESMSLAGDSPDSVMTGLGVNGTAGWTSSSGVTSAWPQILDGEGGPVAIDSTPQPIWYVNNSAGVRIHRCSQAGGCSSTGFGNTPVVDNADVAGDGYTMTAPAPFIIDPLDHNELLVGTCRLWRGPADGTPWTGANAISPVLDGISGRSYCNGDALVRSIAAMPVAGGEVIYVGMFGKFDGGALLGGHVFKATLVSGSSSMPSWRDIALNPVTNDPVTPFNAYGLDISSIFIDPHDPTGNTVYVTVAGIPDSRHAIRTVYRTTDGGASWSQLGSNLVRSPANSVIIDPQDANTAYVATDEGVFATRQIGTCATYPSNCWSPYGAGLPYAPVVQLSASAEDAASGILLAGTYGRGIWQIPLLTAGVPITTAQVEPDSLTFASQPVGTTSSAQTISITNTGAVPLLVTSISIGSSFTETDNCTNTAVSAGSHCAIAVAFVPGQVGAVTNEITINANVQGGRISVPLSGTGISAGLVTASPGTLSFGQVQIGETSASLPVTLTNGETTPVAIASVSATPPFNIASDACGNVLAANSACALGVTFTPAQGGTTSGTLTIADDAGTQTVALSGLGAKGPTDDLSSTTLNFPATVAGQLSSPQVITLSNNGDLPLNLISASAGAGFQASNNCGGSLAAHSTCAISVVFAPASPGTVIGSLIVSNAIRNQTVSLSGTGLQPPTIGVNPATVAFPPQAIGRASAPIPLTISNTGGAPLANIGFQLTGQSAASFSWNASTCGATLASGAFCTVQLTFTPAAAGPLAAVLTVSSSTPGVSPAQVSLSGTGQSASGINITPSQMNFAQTILGQPTAPQIATISNTSGFSANAVSATVNPPFSISQSSCSGTLASGASCTVAIIFTPTTNGVINGTLVVSTSAFSNAAGAILVGAGGAAGSIQVQPASLTFASTGVGAKSTTQTVKLTNNGSVSLAGLNLFSSAGYEVASTTCGSSLEAGAACSASIDFAPTTAGAQSGTLTISSSSLASKPTVSLSGMGFDFNVSSSGSSSQTVSSGQTGRYTLALNPLSGSSGTFTFSCSGVPANSSCSFNPTSETVAANTSGTVTVQIATGVFSSSAKNTDSKMRLLHLLPLTCLICVLPVTLRQQRRTLLAVVLAICLIGIASCASAGGGRGGAPSPGTTNNTPAGTYSIVVTANSNGLSHKATLTLIVD